MLLACLAVMTRPSPANLAAGKTMLVYAIIIESSPMGTRQLIPLRSRFLNDRRKDQGRLRAATSRGVTDKLDDLVVLGIDPRCCYLVVQNDEEPIGKFCRRLSPRGLRARRRQLRPRGGLGSLIDAAHARLLIKVILDMPITQLPGFEHPYVVDPAKKDRCPPTQYGSRPLEGGKA